jgi:DNA-binding transcriptional LysR family regulator
VFDPLALKYFGVVARERSFSRAARILHASQPSVSRRIQQLEHEAGARLFDRNSRGVILTSAGCALARYADEIYRLTDEATHVLRQASKRPSKVFRIGYYQPALCFVLALLHRLKTHHSDIDLEAREGTRAAVLNALRASEIQLALPGYVPPEIVREFDGLRIPGRSWEIVLPVGHRFARRNRLRLAELKNEQFISMDEQDFPGFNILLLDICRRAGFIPKISVYAHSWTEAVVQVIAGRGVGIALRSTLAFPCTAAIKLIQTDINPEWYALWNPSNGNPQLRTITQLLVDHPPSGWISKKQMAPV